MVYKSRIPADPDYIQSLGQALYNFTYLEWIVVWTIVKLSPDGFQSVPKGETASFIAKALINVIDTTAPPLSKSLRHSLVKFYEMYRLAITRRNKLLHAHPYTAEGGLQQLGGGGHRWSIELIDEAAKFFEDAAIMGNGIFHGELAKERPTA